jgi:redox-sensitive bicupin YhaK (pirin superfamily)
LIAIRRSEERGHFDHRWLDTYHTFSFDQYHDPKHMGFRSLRVLNEDRVQGGAGFPTHPHRDMEIVTVILGRGVAHSEYNHSDSEPVHLLQIWLLPAERGLEPGYEQKAFPPEENQNRLRLVASPDGEDGSVVIHQDAWLYLGALDAGRELSHDIEAGRHAWIQVAGGAIRVNDHPLVAGDGAAVSQERALHLVGDNDAELLLFDLA